MASTNVRTRPSAGVTHAGAPAAPMTDSQALRRCVLSCLLWENEFYESGEAVAERLVRLANAVSVGELASLAVEARNKFNLRHVPLLLLSVLCDRTKGTSVAADTIPLVIQRADELGEFLAVRAKLHNIPVSAGMTAAADAPSVGQRKLYLALRNTIRSHGIWRGLGKAFLNFDEYQLAKYSRDTPVTVRDILFLVRPKPADVYDAKGNLVRSKADVEELWKRVANDELATPDTWEVALSGGADKKATFERLLSEGKLGYLALLRNLRNMEQAGVDRQLVTDAILARKGAHRVLPFRYTAAARHAKSFEPALDKALIASLEALPKLPGKTGVLVDVSGSMDAQLSGKSDLTRADAAATLAAIIPSDDLRVFSFSDRTVEVPPRKGMAGVDAILKSQYHSGTDLGGAVNYANKLGFDRLIVITDEQSRSRVPAPLAKHAYMINVASYQNGVGYGEWVHIDGFSENVLRFIAERESL